MSEAETRDYQEHSNADYQRFEPTATTDRTSDTVTEDLRVDYLNAWSVNEKKKKVYRRQRFRLVRISTGTVLFDSFKTTYNGIVARQLARLLEEQLEIESRRQAS